MEKFFDTRSELIDYMVSDLGFTEEYADNALYQRNIAEFEEEPYKRSSRCSGFIYNKDTDLYYCLNYTFDYDWGASDFYLDITPRKAYKETQLVEVTETVYREAN